MPAPPVPNDNSTATEDETAAPSSSRGGAGIFIAAGVVSGVIVIALISAVIFLTLRNRREKRKIKQIVDLDDPGRSPGASQKAAHAHAAADAPAFEGQLMVGSRTSVASSMGDDISITMPRTLSSGEAGTTGRDPQWNFGGDDPSNLVGSRFYIEAPVDRDTPVNGSLEIDFDNEILLESILGSGAFGSVYRGRWRGHDVAVKLMASQGTSLLDSFHAEVEVLSRLKHPNIVQFMGASVVPPHLCLVEELVENGSLWNLLHSERDGMGPPPRPLSLLRTLDLAEEIASALAYIHPTIVHRDLKSGNVLLDSGWHAKVADFGIARFKNNTYMTTHGGGAGTAAYMAPELFSAGRIDEKSDIFSLGVLIWEMYLGEIPWNDCTHPMQVVMAIGVNGERLRLPDDMPKTLSHIIKKCWREDPHRRPSASEFVRYIQKERRALMNGGGTGRGSTSRRSSDGRDIFQDCTRTPREDDEGIGTTSDERESLSSRSSSLETPNDSGNDVNVNRPPGLGMDSEGPHAEAQRLAQAEAKQWKTCHSIISDTSDESSAS